MKDLVCLLADVSQKAALRGLLGRPQAIGIRLVAHDLYVHPRRDPGCFHEAHRFLLLRRREYSRGLVILDRDWEGAPSREADALERTVRSNFASAGLADWADVVVIAPELESWVWSTSPHVPEVLGWAGRSPDLRSWLRNENLWPEGEPKPPDPKKAVERALEQVRRPPSSAIYQRLAETVSVDRCGDAAFQRLRSLLRSWFPPEEAGQPSNT